MIPLKPRKRSSATSATRKKSIELAKKIARSRVSSCQRCGSSTNQLHAHHVIPVRYGHTAAELENLCVICASCHTLGKDAAHQHPHAFQRWYDEKYPGKYDELWVKANQTTKIDWQLKLQELMQYAKEIDLT